MKDALGGVVNNINSYFIIGKIDGQLTFCHDGMWETAFCISMQKVKENGGVFDGKVDDRGDNNTSWSGNTGLINQEPLDVKDEENLITVAIQPFGHKQIHWQRHNK